MIMTQPIVQDMAKFVQNGVPVALIPLRQNNRHLPTIPRAELLLRPERVRRLAIAATIVNIDVIVQTSKNRIGLAEPVRL